MYTPNAWRRSAASDSTSSSNPLPTLISLDGTTTMYRVQAGYTGPEGGPCAACKAGKLNCETSRVACICSAPDYTQLKLERETTRCINVDQVSRLITDMSYESSSFTNQVCTDCYFASYEGYTSAANSHGGAKATCNAESTVQLCKHNECSDVFCDDGNYVAGDSTPRCGVESIGHEASVTVNMRLDCCRAACNGYSGETHNQQNAYSTGLEHVWDCEGNECVKDNSITQQFSFCSVWLLLEYVILNLGVSSWIYLHSRRRGFNQSHIIQGKISWRVARIVLLLVMLSGIVKATNGACLSLSSMGGNSGCNQADCNQQLVCLVDWCCSQSSGGNNWNGSDVSDLDCQIASWDTSAVTSMSQLFYRSRPFGCWSSFNGDISKWDVSAVNDMQHMVSLCDFQCSFNGDISKWDVSAVTSMGPMFLSNYLFNGDISKWDVSAVQNLEHMFSRSSFNGDISKWDVSAVQSLSGMFQWSRFNGDISKWDVSAVRYMHGFSAGTGSTFNGDISKWDVSSLTSARRMFWGNRFLNADLSRWDVSRVTNCEGIFQSTSRFNADISKWDVSACTTVREFLPWNNFNGDISKWDVSRATDMLRMFRGNRKFNGDISKWDVSKVTNMETMFYEASSFRQSLCAWNLRAGVNTGGMFTYAGVSSRCPTQCNLCTVSFSRGSAVCLVHIQ